MTHSKRYSRLELFRMYRSERTNVRFAEGKGRDPHACSGVQSSQTSTAHQPLCLCESEFGHKLSRLLFEAVCGYMRHRDGPYSFRDGERGVQREKIFPANGAQAPRPQIYLLVVLFQPLKILIMS